MLLSPLLLARGRVRVLTARPPPPRPVSVLSSPAFLVCCIHPCPGQASFLQVPALQGSHAAMLRLKEVTVPGAPSVSVSFFHPGEPFALGTDYRQLSRASTLSRSLQNAGV